MFAVGIGPRLIAPAVVEKILNLFTGLVVPTPTLPDCVTIKSVRVEEPTENAGTSVPRLEVSTENFAHGVVEPTPTLPASRKVMRLVPVLLSILTVGVPPAPRKNVVSPLTSRIDVGVPPEPFHQISLPLSSKILLANVVVAVPVTAKLVVVAFVEVLFTAKRFEMSALVEKKLVEVALVEVELTKSAFTKCEVLEAKRPWVNQIGVEVELAVAPKLVVAVNGNEACDGVA